MLLLAHILRSTIEWRDAQIYIKLVVFNRAGAENADMIFMGMATPTNRNFTEYYEQMHARTTNLPTIMYVMAAPDFAFGEI